MIISRGRGYIFVHIPKTGGTSLSLALEARAKKDDILVGDTPKALRRRGRLRGVKTAGRLWKHSSLSQAEGLITRQEMQALFVFTLVRNPWDRAVSYYSWLQDQTFAHPAVALSRELKFAAFLEHPQIQGAFREQPYQSYVQAPDGAPCADLFLRLEHLDEDLPKLEARLSMQIGPLPHVNRSQRAAAYRDIHTDATRRLIASVCARDIEQFGYRF